MTKNIKFKFNAKSKSNIERLAKTNTFDLIKILLFLVGLVCVGLFVYTFVQEEAGYTITKSAVQYYAGNEYQLDENATMVYDLDGNTILTQSSSDRELTSVVIYFNNQDSILLPKDMIYFDPRNNVTARVDHFTEIILNNNITALLNNETVYLNNGFLFDGEDYFVFLEDVTVSINGYRMNLSALSYIDADYSNGVMIFDYDSKTTTMESASSEIVVSVASLDYSVELFNGTLITYDGTKTLLFSRPDLLESIFE